MKQKKNVFSQRGFVSMVGVVLSFGVGLHTTVQVTRGVQNTSGADSVGCRLGGAH